MLRNISREQLIGAWIATLIVAMAISVIAGVVMTMGNIALWLVAAVVPAAVVLLLWHGAPPLSVGQLLHPADDGSPKSRS